MGNTQKGFSPLVAIEENSRVDLGKKFWKLYDSTMNNNQTDVSILEFRDPTPQKQLYECSLRAVKAMKTLRHPYILSYKSGFEKNRKVYIATSPVDPLINILNELTFSERVYGVRNVAIALQFYNDEKCGCAHCNIRLTSIYVTRDKLRKWLIGDFEFSTDHIEITKEHMDKTKSFRVSLPEEYKASKEHAYAIDMFCFSHFLEEVFEGMESELQQLTTLPRFIEEVKNCVDFSRMPTFDAFLDLPIFKRDVFCHIMTYMDNIRTFKSVEKEEFFKNLYPKLQQIPVEIVTKRLVGRMLSVSFLTDLHSQSFLPHLFSPREKNGLLPKPIFEDVIIDFLNVLYESKNRALRLKVIQTIPYYLSSVKPSFVFQVIIPELMDGLYDVDDTIVMATMNGFVTIARYLQQYDQMSQKTRGMDLVNAKFLPSLHHWGVKGGQVRAHAILSCVELWAVKGIRKDIIFSVIQTAIYDMDNQEIQLHVVNALTLHFKKFNVVEIVNIVLPVLLHMSIHEHEEVRQKSVKVIKLIMDDNLENRVFYHDIPRLMKLPKPSTCFPGSSKSVLVRTSRFKGGKYRSLVPDSEYLEDDDDYTTSSDDDYGSTSTLTSGLSTSDDEEEGKKKEKRSVKKKKKKKKKEVVVVKKQKEEEEVIKIEEIKKKKKDKVLETEEEEEEEPNLPSGGEWMSVDNDEEKEKRRIQKILEKARRGGGEDSESEEEEEDDDDDDDDDADWDDWEVSDTDEEEKEEENQDQNNNNNKKKKTTKKKPKKSLEKLPPAPRNDWESGFEVNNIEEEEEEKEEEKSPPQQLIKNNIQIKESEELEEEEEEERKEKEERKSMINDLEKKLLGLGQEKKKKKKDDDEKEEEPEKVLFVQEEEEEIKPEDDEVIVKEEEEDEVVKEEDNPLYIPPEEENEADDDEEESTKNMEVNNEEEEEGVAGESSEDIDDKIDLSGWGGSIQDE